MNEKRSPEDVLLVNPHYNGRSEIPPLGLECIAAPLLEKGISVSILDLDIVPSGDADRHLENRLTGSAPRIVGITSLSNSFPSTLKVCGIAKRINPGILTVLGGMHPTVLADSILRTFAEVDVIVRGEGEKTFLELVHGVFHGRPWNQVKGLSFRNGGEPVHNGDRPLERDLETFPRPARHLVENGDYRTRSLSSSRGCNQECTFCSIQSMYHRTVRARSIDTLVEEMGQLIDSGAKRIMFTDDNFTFSMKRVKNLCREIIRRRWNEQAHFYAEGRIDDICRNPVMPQILSDAGFRGIYMGAESGSRTILDYYRKGIEPDEILRGVGYCVEQNITPVVNFILFGPRDTVETMGESIALARRIFEQGAEIVYAETLTPYPGTPIGAELLRDGKYRETNGVYHFESYEGVDYEWILRLCGLARETAWLLHRTSRYFDTQKAYFELTCLADLLHRRVPSDLLERVALGADGEAADLYRRMKNTIHPEARPLAGTDADGI